MSDQTRGVGRMRRLAGLLALVAAMGFTAAAPAQFGEAAGFTEAMQPEYFRRDLQVFVEGLDLDDAQKVIVESLFWDYEDAFEAGKAAMLERFNDMRDELTSGDRTRVLQLIFTPFADWAVEREALGNQFLSNVQLILTTEQLERWPAFTRQLTREKTLVNGRLSGENLNLFHVIREMQLDQRTNTLAQPALDEYDVALDAALTRRNALRRESQEGMIQSLQTENVEAGIAILEQQVAARIAIRNINDQYIETIAAALPGEPGVTFRRKALERAYPRIFRPTIAERLFDSAKKIDGLSEETLVAIGEIEAAYLSEIASYNDRILIATREHEPKEFRHRAASFNRRLTGERVDKMQDPTRGLYRKREEMGRTYIEQLQAILTPEQFESLPGASRYLKPRPNEPTERKIPPKQRGKNAPTLGGKATGGGGAPRRPSSGSGSN